MPPPRRAASGTDAGPIHQDKKAAARKNKIAADNKAANKTYDQEYFGSSQADNYAAKMGHDPDVMVTEMKMPEWVSILLAVLRISELQFWIQEEREERSKDTYQNPYAEIFTLVSSLRFEGLVAALILLNCVMIGVEASLPPNDAADIVFNVLENGFVAFFLGEWLLRVRAFGAVWIFELPNAADTFLVFGTGVFPKWFLEPMGVYLGNLRVLTVLRALRLVRIVRAVRLKPQFKELWMLIQGLMQSARPLLWTAVIAMMLLYIFGIAATELIGRQKVFEDDDYAQELFGDPMRSMFTLFQLMTMDTWGYTIARPIMAKDWWMSVFFVFFIMVGVFVFWNLITAVIVENAMSIANEDSHQKAKDLEEQKKQELKVLADLFLDMDEDGSGELSSEEFFGALGKKNVKQMLDLLELKPSDMEEVWNVLDDGDGVLTIKEFTNGLRRMKGEAKAKDLIDMIKKLRHAALHQVALEAHVEHFDHTIAALEHDVVLIQNDSCEILGLFQEMYHRFQAHIEKEQFDERMAAAKREKLREFADDEDNSDAEDDGADDAGDFPGGGSPKSPASPSGPDSPGSPSSPG